MLVLLDDYYGLMVVVVVMDDDHRLMVMIDLFWRVGECGGYETERRQSGKGQDDSSHDLSSHWVRTATIIHSARREQAQFSEHTFIDTIARQAPRSRPPAVPRQLGWDR
jgi:hypothetical protein